MRDWSIRESRDRRRRASSASLAAVALVLCLVSAPLAVGVFPTADGSGIVPLGPHQIEVAFPNLSLPKMVHLTDAGDGTDRLFAVLQQGEIVVFPNDESVVSASTFLDIRNMVSVGFEEGLLGLAFDPNYRENGHFYVHYTEGSPGPSVISRFSVSGGDPGVADPQSELVLLEVPQPFSNHNGGAIEFGPEGLLYIALGDGGSGGDPLDSGQDTSTLLGSILRIDVRNSTVQEPYRIPPSNPFVGGGGGPREEIYAYGLRNPWKMTFDPWTGDLWAADVGQGVWEEIDVVTRGGNYGWRRMEGAHCFNPSTACELPGLVPPVFEYDHSLGCSITGGYVYRGSRVWSLAHAYVYADYCTGRIWGLRYNGETVTEQALLFDSSLSISSFGRDQQGELYVLEHRSSGGKIYRFVAPPLPAVPGATGWGLTVIAGGLFALLVWRAGRPQNPARVIAIV